MDTRMLRVSKIPTDATEDSLRFFFENTKRNGGGDIEELEYNSGTHTAIIIFEEDGVVQRILGKTPLLLNDKIIQVEAYFSSTKCTPDKRYQQDDEHPNLYAIKVSNFDETSTSKDTLLYYFESRKGTNADVLSIEPDEEGETSYILTFENEKAIQSALEKSHRLGKQTLKVDRYISPPPTPNYTEKAFISNINNSTADELLRNFLEARSKEEILEIEKGENEGSALVTFTDVIDIPLLQQQCQKRRLEGNFLQVTSVPMTKCVIVTGFKETTSADTLEFYFDNKKRSGVDGVVETTIGNDEGHCLIYFDDYQAAVTVCEGKHIVEGCQLKVRLYFECLGKRCDEPDDFQCPTPLEVKNIDELKLMFIRSSKSFQEKIDENLRPLNAKIQWQLDITDTIQIECTLNKSQKNVRKLAKNWALETENELTKLLERVEIKRHHTIAEIWNEVTQHLAETTYSEDIVIYKDDDAKIISIIGTEVDTTHASKILSAVIQNFEKILDEKRKEVMDTYRLTQNEAHILAGISFGSSLMKEIEGLKIAIDTNSHKVQFTGLAGDIAQAKFKMLEKTKEIVSTKIDKTSKGMVLFLNQPDVQALLNSKLKEKQLTVTWETKDENSVVFYAISDQEAVTAVNIFRESVGEIHVDLDTSEQLLLKSKLWEKLVENIQKLEKDKIRIEISDDFRKITAYATITSDGDLGQIREQIQDFIYK